jgi:hypothetical protein
VGANRSWNWGKVLEKGLRRDSVRLPLRPSVPMANQHSRLSWGSCGEVETVRHFFRNGSLHGFSRRFPAPKGSTRASKLRVFGIIFRKIRKTFSPKLEQGNQHLWVCRISSTGWFFVRSLSRATAKIYRMLRRFRMFNKSLVRMRPFVTSSRRLMGEASIRHAVQAVAGADRTPILCELIGRRLILPRP